MRKNGIIQLLIVAITIIITSCNPSKMPKEQKEEALPLAAFEFKEKVFDFGKIRDGEKVSHEFKFSNVGQNPLVIKDISTSCGCTAVEWTKKPVPPRGEGVIKVEFHKQNDPGMHLKAVIIKANTSKGYTVIRIRALI